MQAQDRGGNSSAEEDDDRAEGANAKKRRVQRACDVCRRKKVRCDGATRPGSRCSNCVAFNFDCTYVEAAKKRGPPKGYVESLENRLEKMERLLQRLCPGADFTQSLGQHLTREQWEAQRGGKSASRGKSAQPTAPPQTNLLSGTRGTSTVAPAPDPSKEEDLISSDEESNLVNGMQKLAVTTFERRFHGKSSGLMLVKAARSLKQEYVNSENPCDDPPQQSRRPEFWRANPWEWIDTEDPLWKDKVQPPPDDLRDALIDLFFKHVNAFFPLLHRPLFESNVRDGLHFTDSAFACVLLLVCAVGSRWSDDRRVFLDQDEPLQHSAGWKYFEQVQFLRRSLLTPPKLFDLQIMALAVMFLQGTSAPHSAWTVAGIGIRIAQDVGAHRRKVYKGGQGSIEDELWKRAFWILVVHDRVTSSALGRPCAIQDEDSDVGFPVEVDDEYWPHQPDPSFVPAQPTGVPARIAFFNCYLKLIQILGFALRTIYSINKSKILLGFVGPQWEQHIVAELDSALNKWIDSVPDHLRWDPNREDSLFFDQSATLYSTYYHVQILIHRPFIPSPRKPSPLSFPSLAICTTAARSCSHVLDLQRRRSQTILPGVMVAAFTSGIVLLINVWGQKKSGGTADPNGQIKDVHKCMEVLKNNEHRWHSAGRLWDILYELASFGDLPLPQPSPKESNKRERESETTTSPNTGHYSSASENTPSPGGSGGAARDRPIAKPRSVLNKAAQQQQQQHVPQVPQQQQHYTQQSPYAQQTLPTPPTFGVANLPVNTSELGSMHHLPPDFMFEQQNNPLHGIWHEQSHDPLVSLFGTAGAAQGQGYAAGAEASGVGYYPTSQQPQPQQQPQVRQGYAAGGVGGYMGEQQSGGFVPGMAAQPFVGGGAFEMWQQAPPGFEMDDWGAMLSQDMLGAGQGMDSRASTSHGVSVAPGQHNMGTGQHGPGQM
ncbi:unnamed protein product [Rhizoctonia solani]|uniref:Zn(2)-C6 fungal-type domain-containing protein n=1 Tax=Rhizoctonia solani TaxID=456999 RepID=A0A8H3GZK1_9AGAM|nr:unnamed protein product [Rhizoctonia solani]